MGHYFGVCFVSHLLNVKIPAINELKFSKKHLSYSFLFFLLTTLINLLHYNCLTMVRQNQAFPNASWGNCILKRNFLLELFKVNEFCLADKLDRNVFLGRENNTSFLMCFQVFQQRLKIAIS